jgi:hypothetical protein
LLAEKRLYRIVIILAGILLPQVVLLGPTLTGQKVLLPLEVLRHPTVYMPLSESKPLPPEMVKSDLIYDHLLLRFAAEEFRSGRLPLWSPYNYAGAPFATYCKYSPFNIPFYLYPHPISLAWMQLLRALTAGVGAYLFFRGALKVGFWPAAVGGWCFPLTAFFVFWQGYQVAQAVVWLPWLLLSIAHTTRQAAGWGGPALALVTALVLVSGQIAIAGQVLIVSALYAVWCLVETWWASGRWRRTVAGGGALTAGWVLGFCLAAPFVLPLVDYARTGMRIEKRAAGTEERPPIGLSAAAQLVLPYVYGSWESDTAYLVRDNLFESAAAGYAGLFAALLAAPLAWCSRRHWGVNFFWLGLALVSVSWVLNLPGFVSIFRLPVLNFMPANRFVFAAGFAVVALAVTGLEAIGQGGVWPRIWFGVPMLGLAALGGWWFYRSAHLPGSLHEELPPSLAHAEEAFRKIQEVFSSRYLVGTALCALALAGWLVVLLWSPARAEFAALLAAGMVVELVAFQYDYYPQGDPALYFPDLPVFSRLATMPPGRVLGCWALPPTLNLRFSLRDVRGYDGADPRRVVTLLMACREPGRYPPPSYALTQYYYPKFHSETEQTLPGALNLLNIRYLLFRGDPKQGARALLQGQDYWVQENPEAMPRVWVPRQVHAIPEDEAVLAELLHDDFDPAQTAYVPEPLDLPDACGGEGEVLHEVPSEVTVAAHMRTPGLLILADAWYEGWRAFVNGAEVPIVRTDYLLRGVQLAAGESTVVFRYEPAGFVWGTRLMVGALAALLPWSLLVRRWSRSAPVGEPGVS